ncbi:unnamed protein product [Larinioides sclopetarius]|uniref:Uncharacterized protein n=1 Tax=Larinioides sclopetarius TaxID=280406 RepID=A0AAV2B854_9ARAC
MSSLLSASKIIPPTVVVGKRNSFILEISGSGNSNNGKSYHKPIVFGMIDGLHKDKDISTQIKIPKVEKERVTHFDDVFSE